MPRRKIPTDAERQNFLALLIDYETPRSGIGALMVMTVAISKRAGVTTPVWVWRSSSARFVTPAV